MRKRDTWRDPKVAAEYDRRRFEGPLQRLKHRRDEVLVTELLDAAGAGPLVLDLPAGTGRLVPALSASGRRVGAVDVSLEMLRASGLSFSATPAPASGPADEAAGAEISGAPGSIGSGAVLGALQASAFQLPFASRSVDAIVSMRFLFHLDDRSERVRVLEEFARISRGPVVGQVRYRATFKHFGRWARSRVGLSRRYAPSLSRAQIAEELSEAGLELARLVPVSRAFSDKALCVALPRSRA